MKLLSAFRLLILIGFFVFLTPLLVSAYSSPGQPTGYVNDFAGILSPDARTQLEMNLTRLEASTSAQIAVVTIKSLQGDTIENFTVKLFEEWKIGQKGKDNGVLLLVAVDERKVRIETGYGLEENLTDARSSSIIRNIITPSFKEGDFNRGILEGVEAISRTINGDTTPSHTNPVEDLGDSFQKFIGIFVFLIFALQWLGSVMARSRSWWLGGVIGGIVGIIVTFWAGFYIAGLITFLLFIPIGLLFDYLVSRQYRTSRETNSYPWWIGGRSGLGGWSSGRSGGGGFGGFGGGRSGGGGSSGGW